MAQDTALLRYLLKGARRAPGSGSQRDLAFAFDGTNDYISSNATIGRTGYDMNVAGNVTTGSDGDGSYIQFNGTRDYVAATGTEANIGGTANTTPTYTQSNSFTIKTKFKFSAFPANGSSGLFGSNFDAVININNSNLVYGIRGSSTVLNSFGSIAINTLYDMYLVYDNLSAKFYGYLSTAGGASVLLNTGGTSGPATFTANAWTIGDAAHASGGATSVNKYIYHAAIRNKALTQAEIDADIALGNTTKNDPSIVAYYIPENLTYNTQYGLNPKALDQSNWTKTGATTVTADTTVAPDGTTTADTLAISGTASQGCTQSITSISGSSIASKTFIVKAFVKVAAGTSLFRLECTHTGVATYNSADLTATTTRQEFTFTQTFTSSTSGTGITYGIDNSSGATNPTLQVRNVRVFLVNETLRDESPNIGGFIGWKTPLVMSARVKPNIDSADTATRQCFFQLPRHYMQLRTTSNFFQFRSETTLTARIAPTQSLGIGFRGKTHMLFVKYRDGTGWLYKAYVNGALVSGAQTAYSNTARPAGTIYRTNASVGFYSTDYRSGNIRDIRAYTFTGSFTDADALAIYNGGEPTSSGVTKYLHYRPPVGEVGTTTQDQSTNDRDGTLNGGVTRDYI